MSSVSLSYQPPAPPAGMELPALRHLDGMPVRAAVCDAILFKTTPESPRVAARQLLDARLWTVPGIYALLWPETESGQLPLYVGSAADLIERLAGHEQIGWKRAVLLTGYGVGTGQALQVERAFGVVVRAAKGVEVRWERHPRSRPADMPWPLLDPLIVLLDLCLIELGHNLKLDPAKYV